MKRILALLSVTAMMLALTAMPAMAQNVPIQITEGNLIAALNNVNVNISDVDVDDVSDINDITVNVNALQNFLNRNNVEVNVEDLLNDANVEILNNNTVTIAGVEIVDGVLVILV